VAKAGGLLWHRLSGWLGIGICNSLSEADSNRSSVTLEIVIRWGAADWWIRNWLQAVGEGGSMESDDDRGCHLILGGTGHDLEVSRKLRTCSWLLRALLKPTIGTLLAR
jgi:hypothetical protein